MMFVLLVVVLCTLGVAMGNNAFLETHLSTMKELLKRRESEGSRLHRLEHKIEDVLVDAHAIKFLVDIHDGEDGSCDDLCVGYITEKMLEGKAFMDWQWFADTISKIYGDELTSDPYMPQELHLALTADSSIMNIMYVTVSELSAPFVQWRTSPADASGAIDWTDATTVSTASAVPSTYRVPQKWWPIFTGTIYTSNMSDLAAGTSYTYRVGGTAADGTVSYSAEFAYKAQPPRDPSRKTTIATLADHGTFELLGWKTMQVMKAQQAQLGIDTVHVSGDLSYAGLSTEMKYLGVGKEDEFEHVWDLLFIQNQPVAATVPWMVTNGNHERFYDWAAYRARFTMPDNRPGGLASNGSFWYTYEYGNSRWISISSEHDLEVGSPQNLFLVQALEEAVANRAQVPWIVVSIHKPMYCSNGGWGNAEGMSQYQGLLESYMIQYDVDLMVTGHLHAYERVHPSANGQVTVYPENTAANGGIDTYYSTGKGPVQVVQGNTGGMQGGTHNWLHPAPDWSGKRFGNGVVPKNETSSAEDKEGIIQKIKKIKDYHYIDTYGFGLATFHNATHMYYQAIPVEANNVGTDAFWVVKRQ